LAAQSKAAAIIGETGVAVLNYARRQDVCLPRLVLSCTA